MAKYTYVVADLLTNQAREEMPFVGVKWSKVLNAPGSFTARMNANHPKATRGNLDPGRTAIYVYRGKSLVWGGILWTVQKTDGVDLYIGAEGFFSYFTKRRRIRHTRSYAQVDQLEIARDLIQYAQDPTFAPGGDLGIQVGTELSGRLRDRTYHAYDRKPIGEAISQLSAVIDGFDFTIEVSGDMGTEPVKTFRTFYPRRGRRTNFVFEQGANVKLLSWSLDATRQANVYDAIGAGEGDAMLIATAADPNQLNAYPLFEDVVTHKDVSRLPTLAAHAQRALLAHKRTVAIPKFTVRVTPDSTIGSFVVGDEVSVRADDGFVQLDGLFRIHSYEVGVSDEGEESIEMTFIERETFE